MKKVMVAGATGYLGRFVVQEFHSHGYWVRALARNPKKLEQTGPYLEPEVANKTNEVFVGQVTVPETLNGLCDGIDIVFSLPGERSVLGIPVYPMVSMYGFMGTSHRSVGKPISSAVSIPSLDIPLDIHLEILA